MKAIIKSRQMGKTYDLIEMANKVEGNYNLIVCFSRIDAERVWRIIKEKEYVLPKPISFKEFMEGSYLKKTTKIFIDNIDLCLQFNSKKEILAVTLNTDGRDL